MNNMNFKWRRERKKGKERCHMQQIVLPTTIHTSPHTKEDITTFLMTRGKGDFGSHD
jgi:hypothetical protein